MYSRLIFRVDVCPQGLLLEVFYHKLEPGALAGVVSQAAGVVVDGALGLKDPPTVAARHHCLTGKL